MSLEEQIARVQAQFFESPPPTDFARRLMEEAINAAKFVAAQPVNSLAVLQERDAAMAELASYLEDQ